MKRRAILNLASVSLAGWTGHTGAGTQMAHVTEIDPDNDIGYVLFTNDERLDAQAGPGGSLIVVIHQWLQQWSRGPD